MLASILLLHHPKENRSAMEVYEVIDCLQRHIILCRRTASGSFSRVASFSDRSISSAAACSVVPMTRSRSACKSAPVNAPYQVRKGRLYAITILIALRMRVQFSSAPGSASAKRGGRCERAAPRLRATPEFARLSAAAQSFALPALQPHISSTGRLQLG